MQRLAGIHTAVFFGPAVVRSMFRSGAGGVGAPAFFMISPFFSMQGMTRTAIHAIHAIRAVFPVLLINVAETANASLDMTAAVAEAAPIVSLISTT